jgi:hypothetical protein
MNSRSRRLRRDEARLMRDDYEIGQRVVRSYKLMLDFYGLRLADELRGTVGRAPNWRNRFRNLNDHSHNTLRLTRILVSLGELGFASWKEPLVRRLTEEVENGAIEYRDSLESYWKRTLQCDTLAYRTKYMEDESDRTESAYLCEQKRQQSLSQT